MALYQESLDANHFRLASISIPQKGEPPSITLTTHHLADDAKPQYHGLSYTWGPPRRDIPDYTEADCRKIILNGHAVNVVPNLYEAIIQLDKSHPETPVWIDALCINQTDLDERHAQVSSMDRIYGGADRVLIWLGAPTPELKLGLKVADRIGDTAFEESKRIIRTQKYDFCPSIADMQARYNLTPFTIEEASGLIALYESSWFGRIWVIQEVALAKKAEILCDDLVIPFDKVGSTAAFLHLSALLGAIVTVLLATTKPNIDLVGGINLYQAEGIQLLREWCKGPRSGWLEVLPFIDFTAGIQDESLINTGPGHKPSISMVLLKLLLWTSGFRASDSRDSIYGLGGILQHIAREQGIAVPERLRPNYTISAAGVLQTVAAEILEATGDLTLLTLVQDPAKQPEAVGQLASQSLPVGLLLLVGKLEQRVVEALELFVFFGNDGVISPFTSGSATSSAASPVSSLCPRTLAKLNWCDIEENGPQSPQSARPMTRNSAFSPGYLGSTSHTTVFNETRESLSILEESEVEYAETKKTHQPSQMDLGFYDLPLPARQMCLVVLQCVPGQPDAHMVFRNEPCASKSWVHVAVARIVPALLEMFDLFYQYDSPLEKVADVLCRNTARPMKDNLDNPHDWIDQFCGQNLRWESLGLLWAHVEGASDALAALQRRLLEWVPGKQSTETSILHIGYCIEISRHFTDGNDLLLDLCRRKSTLGTMVYGDARVHAQGETLKQQSQTRLPSFCAENKRRLFSYIFLNDKSIVSFTGRPPLLSRRYCSSPLPLDIQDDDLMSDRATLEEVTNRLDDRGWDTRGEIYSVTLVRARTLVANILDELIEIALGKDANISVDYLQSIKARQIQTFSELPSCLIFDHRDLSSPDLRVEILYARILLYLFHLQNMFLVERLLLQRGAIDEGNLLVTSFDMVKVTVAVWLHKDRFAAMRRNFEWLLMAYAAPGGGILCQELLRPTFYGVHPLDSTLSRSSLVQQLSLLVAFLNWVSPTAPNGNLCADCQAIIQRVLDQHLNTPADSSQSLESLDLIFPRSPAFRFDLLNTFDWVHDERE
ncbi:hypothetical protein NM208_g6969 [Fusarium decemcellulare]|uniref:Uncharacterized protein n=1 Tax=Fusarium decemcellulare TaxID=57161 RepID=A0ACC1SAX2_9HYPO|nr:hypothetical protein NM208_g6969 [Fusarium decemcellulare]